MLFRLLLLSGLALGTLCSGWAMTCRGFAADAIPAGDVTNVERLTFEQHIRPLLKTHCFHCHGDEDQREGKLDLRLRRLIAVGGDSGPGLVAGHPGESLLLKRVRANEMPPNGKTLAVKEVDLIERWIAAGAVTARDEPADLALVSDITAEDKAFWSFQPVRRPPVPDASALMSRGPMIAGGQAMEAFQGSSLAASGVALHARTAIDPFVLEKLAAKGLGFSPDAERATFARRVTFDLLGLPPTPAEIDAFATDVAPDAHERLVDRLLASPHYGERWGRHWLDVAGYADSDGYTEADPVRKYSFKYRDWVISAFNADLPFDQFVIEQLAGDELVKPPHANLSQAAQDHLIATGFLRTVADGTGQGADPKVSRNAVVAETIKVASSALLGLTVGCAECHNHRYDPISQADYYRMRAIFEPALNWKAWRNPAERLITLYTDTDRAQAAAVEAEARTILDEREKKLNAAIEVIFERELAKVPEEHRERVKVARTTKDAERTPEQIALLKDYPSADPKPYQIDLYDPVATAELKKDDARAAEVRKKKPVEDFVSPLTELPGQVPETVLFHRGDPDQPKQVLAAGELSALDWLPALVPATSEEVPTSGRRLAYARHLTTGQHPLVSRVMANRVWLTHFGRGLVATPGDFGVLGDRPTHPELLDWLAVELVNPEPAGSHHALSDPSSSSPNPHRWSVKRFHRLVVGSSVYRQSSARNVTADGVDPDNRLLARMSVRRLEAEAVRDAMHAINGTINHKLGGPPVPVMLDEDGQVVIGIENLNGENRPGAIIPLHGEEHRRSVYVQVRRTRLLAVLDAFDLPTLDPNCTARNSSTVAPQSLLLMNSDFVLTAARQLAERLIREAGPDPASRIQYSWPLLFGRAVRDAELSSALQFIDDEQARLAVTAEGVADPKLKPDPNLWAWATFCQALFGSNEFLYVD
jgi:mono/diheme cytochrome c family protein